MTRERTKLEWLKFEERTILCTLKQNTRRFMTLETLMIGRTKRDHRAVDRGRLFGQRKNKTRVVVTLQQTLVFARFC